MKYIYDPPYIVKKFFNRFIWESSNDKILLTFDDGPNPGTTEIILNELDRHKIKAVFFFVGNNIKDYPFLAKEVMNSGHMTANHTYNHKIITKLNKDSAAEEIRAFNEIHEEILNSAPEYFRPPHGKFNLHTQSLINKFGMKNVMWSLMTHDYKNDFEIVKYSVKNFLRKNSVIVLHDNKKSKDIICDSIKFIVEETDRNGFTFGEPEECLK